MLLSVILLTQLVLSVPLSPNREFVVFFSKGSFGNFALPAGETNTNIRQTNAKIVRRRCPTCTPTHREIFYKRLVDDSSFDYYNNFITTWNGHVGFNQHYSLHSTLEDALNGKNPWQFCNGGDVNIGFPRDCGPRHSIDMQWNSQTRGGQGNVEFSYLTEATCTNECVSTPGWTIDTNPVTTCGWVEGICGPMRRGECLEHGGSVKCHWGYVSSNHWANQRNGSPVANCCNCKGFDMPDNYDASMWPNAPSTWVWNGKWKNTHTSDGTDLPICPPTASPTTRPTKAPTTSPSTAPTTSPTSGPTKAPTTSPTSAPTKAPTTSPTSAPTKAPTTSPTTGPTKAPTTSPTSGPTKAPTTSPTSAPTKAPTTSPTSAPTKAPTYGDLELERHVAQWQKAIKVGDVLMTMTSDESTLIAHVKQGARSEIIFTLNCEKATTIQLTTDQLESSIEKDNLAISWNQDVNVAAGLHRFKVSGKASVHRIRVNTGSEDCSFVVASNIQRLLRL